MNIHEYMYILYTWYTCQQPYYIILLSSRFHSALTLGLCLVEHPAQFADLAGQLRDTAVEECRGVAVARRRRGRGTQPSLQVSEGWGEKKYVSISVS